MTWMTGNLDTYNTILCPMTSNKMYIYCDYFSCRFVCFVIVAIPLAATLFTALKHWQRNKGGALSPESSKINYGKSGFNNYLLFSLLFFSLITCIVKLLQRFTLQDYLHLWSRKLDQCSRVKANTPVDMLSLQIPGTTSGCVFLDTVWNGSCKCFVYKTLGKVSWAQHPPSQEELTPLCMAFVFSACYGSFVATWQN